MNDRDILRQASDNSDEWSDETWAAWGRLADQAHGHESGPTLKPLSPDYLAEIAARADAVTDGPWGPYLGATPNVFIAHVRTDVPALLAEVERLRAALSSATDVIAERDDEIGDWSAKNAALRAELADRPTRAEVLRNAYREAHRMGQNGHSAAEVAGQLRLMAIAADLDAAASRTRRLYEGALDAAEAGESK